MPSTFLMISAPPLAVVPVLVNAGAALLPAIVAALASALALVLKPREFLRAVRRRPLVALAVLALVAGSWLGWRHLAAQPAKAAIRESVPTTSDWSKVALEVMRQERDTPRPPSIPDPTASMAASKPVVFRNNFERNGFSGGASPESLQPLWEYNEDNTLYLSSPIMDGERVYGASAYLDVGKTYGAIFCLDSRSGKVIWQTDSEPQGRGFSGFFSSPALTADRKSLVIGQGLHADAGVSLVCLNTETGAVRWVVRSPLHIESSPAIEGDIVVVGAGAIETGPDHKPSGDPNGIGNPGYVFGVRISDGRELWRYPLNDPEGSPAIEDGVAYIGSGVNGAAVAALRIASDEDLKASGLDRLVWKVPAPHAATGAVTLVKNLVLVGCGRGDFVFSDPNPEGVVLALEKTTGKTVWKTVLPDAVLGSIAVVDGRAIVPVRNGELVALNIEDGQILWRQEDPKARISGTSAVLSSPAFTGTLIYATSQDGYLAVIDPADGKILERHYINATDKPGELGLTFSSPWVGNGVVIVGSETGGLRAFSGKSAR